MISRQLNLLGQQRVDLPTFRAMESSVCHDFDVLAGKMLAGTWALVLKGFVVDMTGAVGNPASSIEIVVADSMLMHYSASESGTIFSVPAGQANEQLISTNTNVSGSWTSNAINFVGLDLRRTADDSTSDTAQFLEPTTNQEIPKTLPMARTLNYRFVISTTDFAGQPNVLPIAQVTTDANNAVTAVADCRNLMFRLGSGGDAPDNQYAYAWPGTRKENTTGDVFAGGDKPIGDLKTWMDAAMTRLWELGGGEFWYSATADRNVNLIWTGATFTNGENFEWDGTDLHWKGLKFLFDNSTGYYNDVANQTINSAGLTNMADGECIYVDLDRTTNRTGGTALQAYKTVLTTMGPGTIPGARQILAWRIGTAVYTRNWRYAVGTTYIPATTTSLGVVQLNKAPASAPTPSVVSIMAGGKIQVDADAGGGGAAATAITGNGGGNNAGATGGHGIQGTGGNSDTGYGGIGVWGYSGSQANAAYNVLSGSGVGIRGEGGAGDGVGNRGATGVWGIGGVSGGGAGAAGYGAVFIGGAGAGAGASGHGVYARGGSGGGSNGVGGTFEAGGTDAVGLSGQGGGQTDNAFTVGNTTASGGVCIGGNGVGNDRMGGTGLVGQGGDGVAGNANGGVGLVGLGGVKTGTGTAGWGVYGLGGTDDGSFGVVGTSAATNGHGVKGSATGTGQGVIGVSSGDASSAGVRGDSGGTAAAVYGSNTGGGPALKGVGGWAEVPNDKDFRYATARTGYLVMGATDFHKLGGTGTGTFGIASVWTEWLSDAGGGITLWAVAHLPRGATITNVYMHERNASGGNADIDLSMYQGNYHSGAANGIERLAVFSKTYTSANADDKWTVTANGGAGWTAGAFTNTTLPTGDSGDHNSGYVEVICNLPAVANVAFQGVRIEYTYQRVDHPL